MLRAAPAETLRADLGVEGRASTPEELNNSAGARSWSAPRFPSNKPNAPPAGARRRA
jgi:hypothetical protein